MLEINEKSYTTRLGCMYNENSTTLLTGSLGEQLKGNVNLIFTSPPFPLKRKKKYGNLNGEEYKSWLCNMALAFKELLSDDGSIIIELGNSWESGSPEFSTLPLESLLEFKAAGNFHLCQEFIHYNPSRLPSPIEWVNKKRVRVKDAYTKLWWLSNSPMPKANNRNVLVPYSNSMQKLLNRQKYNSGVRPSEHKIGETSFLQNNGGAIPSNVITASNTIANDSYINYCKKHSLEMHPARMVHEIPEFFIRFLTDENDLVFDPFAGSNTTGYVAEKLNRKWVSSEIDECYFKGSLGRFINADNGDNNEYQAFSE